METKIEYVQISELIAADYNPRKLSEKQHADIRNSLDIFGFVDPIIVNKHPDRMNVIVGGHQRVKVWRNMGNNIVPAVFVALPLEKERELNIRLNKNTGEWDWDVLKAEFLDDDLEGFGFDSLNFPEDKPVKETQKNEKESLPKDSVECPHCGELVDIGLRVKGMA